MQRRRVFEALRGFFGRDDQRTSGPAGSNDVQDDAVFTDGSSYSYSETDDEPAPTESNALHPTRSNAEMKDTERKRQTRSGSRNAPSRTQSGAQAAHQIDGLQKGIGKNELTCTAQTLRAATEGNVRVGQTDASSEIFLKNVSKEAGADVCRRKSLGLNIKAASGGQLPVVPLMGSAKTTSGVIGRAGKINATDIERASVSALRSICKELGIPSSGAPDDLKKRAIEKISSCPFQGEETQALASKAACLQDSNPRPSNNSGKLRSIDEPAANSSAPDGRRVTTTTTSTRANSARRQSDYPAQSRAFAESEIGSLNQCARNDASEEILGVNTVRNAPTAALSSTGFHDFQAAENSLYASGADSGYNRNAAVLPRDADHVRPSTAPGVDAQAGPSNAPADISTSLKAPNGRLSLRPTTKELSALRMAFKRKEGVLDEEKSEPSPTSNMRASDRGVSSLSERLSAELMAGRDRVLNKNTASPGTPTLSHYRTLRPPTLPVAPPNTPGLSGGPAAPRDLSRRHSLHRSVAEMAANSLQRARSASDEVTAVVQRAEPNILSPEKPRTKLGATDNAISRVLPRTDLHIDGVVLNASTAVAPRNSTAGDIHAPKNTDNTKLGSGVNPIAFHTPRLPSPFRGAEGGPTNSSARQPQADSNPITGVDAGTAPSQRPPRGNSRRRPAAVRLTPGSSLADIQQQSSETGGQMSTPHGAGSLPSAPSRPAPVRPAPVRATPARPTPTRLSGFPTPSDIIRTFNRYTPAARPASTSLAQNGSARRPYRRPSSERFSTGNFHRISGSAFGVSLTATPRPSGPSLFQTGANVNAGAPAGSPLLNPKRHSTGMASFRRHPSSASGGKLNDLRKNRRSVDFGRPGALQSLNDMHATRKWRENDRSAAMATSAKKILEGLNRTREQNRIMIANRRPVSPLGPPPSAVKRAREESDLLATGKRMRRSATDSGTFNASAFDSRPSVPSPVARNLRGSSNRRAISDLGDSDLPRRNKRKSRSFALERDNEPEDILERVATRKRRSISYSAASNLGSAFKAYALAQSNIDESRKSDFRSSVQNVARELESSKHVDGKDGATTDLPVSHEKENSNQENGEKSVLGSFSFPTTSNQGSKSVGFSPAPALKPLSSSNNGADITDKTANENGDTRTRPVLSKKITPIISKSPSESAKKTTKAVTFADRLVAGMGLKLVKSDDGLPAMLSLPLAPPTKQDRDNGLLPLRSPKQFPSGIPGYSFGASSATQPSFSAPSIAPFSVNPLESIPLTKNLESKVPEASEGVVSKTAEKDASTAQFCFNGKDPSVPATTPTSSAPTSAEISAPVAVSVKAPLANAESVSAPKALDAPVPAATVPTSERGLAEVNPVVVDELKKDAPLATAPSTSSLGAGAISAKPVNDAEGGSEGAKINPAPIEMSAGDSFPEGSAQMPSGFSLPASKPGHASNEPFAFNSTKLDQSGVDNGFGSSSQPALTSSEKPKSSLPAPRSKALDIGANSAPAPQNPFVFSSQSTPALSAPAPSQSASAAASSAAFGGSFGQASAPSSSAPQANLFGGQSSSGFGSSFGSKPAGNPFGSSAPSGAGGDPFSKFPSSFNPTAPLKGFTFNTAPVVPKAPASNPTLFGSGPSAPSAAASVKPSPSSGMSFGGQQTSNPFGGGSSSGNAFVFGASSGSTPAAFTSGAGSGSGVGFGFGSSGQSAPSPFGSGPSSGAGFGSGSGFGGTASSGGAFGSGGGFSFGAASQPSVPSGFGSGPPFGVPCQPSMPFGTPVSSQFGAPIQGAPSQAQQTLFGAAPSNDSGSAGGFSIGASKPNANKTTGRRVLKVRRSKK